MAPPPLGSEVLAKSSLYEAENDTPVAEAGNEPLTKNGVSKGVWPGVQGSSGTTTALTHIYSPPSHPIPTTPQGIVAHALDVAGDPRAFNAITAQASFKKVAKKRRKQNGGVDVEHTKSSKEFLRKAQQALRSVKVSDSVQPETLSETSTGTAATTGTGSALNIKGSLLGGTGLLGKITTVRSKAADVSDDSNSDEFRTNKSTGGSESSNPASEASNPYGYEDPDKASSSNNNSSNPYGYEDPDAAMATAPLQRPRGSARRRNSVTEHSLRAVHQAAAAAAMDRLRRLKLARTELEHSMNIQRNKEAPSTANNSNPYGYEDPDTPPINNRVVATASKPVNSAALHLPSQDQPMGPPKNVDPAYEYEMTTPLNDTTRPAPMRRRARRRGSVTEYSLRAARDVAVAAQMEQEAASMEVESQHSPNPGLKAPVMPTRKLSPWNATAKSARMASLARSVGPPVVQASAARDQRLRSHSGDLSHLGDSLSGDALSVSYRTNISAEFTDSSSDEESSHGLLSLDDDDDDDSLDGSVTSMTVPLKTGPSDRAMRPPSRHDSFHSFVSRGSVQSFESDGDSLAPDMQSLCSTSRKEKRSQGTAAPVPSSLPRTPTNMSRKGISRNNSKGYRERALANRERYVDRFPSGSLPMVAFAGRAGDTSPIPSPQMQPRIHRNASSSNGGKSILNPNYLLSNSTLPLASTGQSLATSTDNRLGGAGTGRGMK